VLFSRTFRSLRIICIYLRTMLFYATPFYPPIIYYIRWDHFEEDTDLNPPRKDPKKWQALQDPSSSFHDKTSALVVSSGLGASRRRHLWPLWSGGRAMAGRHPVGTYEKLSGQPATIVKGCPCFLLLYNSLTQFPRTCNVVEVAFSVI
jgi:hypothetical protein